jgi:hypothetical protein
MRLYLINPSNPLVSIVKVKESRWNRYRVWKPLSLMVLAGLTPPEWEISIVDENLGAPDYPAMPRILRRLWGNLWQQRKPLISLVGNLSSRGNIRLNCKVYADFKRQRGNRYD